MIKDALKDLEGYFKDQPTGGILVNIRMLRSALTALVKGQPDKEDIDMFRQVGATLKERYDSLPKFDLEGAIAAWEKTFPGATSLPHMFRAYHNGAEPARPEQFTVCPECQTKFSAPVTGCGVCFYPDKPPPRFGVDDPVLCTWETADRQERCITTRRWCNAGRYWEYQDDGHDARDGWNAERHYQPSPTRYVPKYHVGQVMCWPHIEDNPEAVKSIRWRNREWHYRSEPTDYTGFEYELKPAPARPLEVGDKVKCGNARDAGQTAVVVASGPLDSPGFCESLHVVDAICLVSETPFASGQRHAVMSRRYLTQVED